MTGLKRGGKWKGRGEEKRRGLKFDRVICPDIFKCGNLFIGTKSSFPQ